MQKGGVVVKAPYTIEDATEFFLANSNFEILSFSTKGGILFKIKLKEGIESPFVSSRSNNPNTDIKEMLFKLVFLNEDENKRFQIISRRTNKPIVDLNNTTQIEFETEIATQKRVYEASEDIYLERLCPKIVSTIIISGNKRTEFIDSLVNSLPIENPNPDNRNWNDINYILLSIHQKLLAPEFDFNFGIIFMECLEGFTTLKTAIETEIDPHIQLYLKELALLQLIEFHKKTGMYHGDPHQGNFMVNPPKKSGEEGGYNFLQLYEDTHSNSSSESIPNRTFLPNMNSCSINGSGKAEIIDFGLSKVIPEGVEFMSLSPISHALLETHLCIRPDKVKDTSKGSDSRRRNHRGYDERGRAIGFDDDGKAIGFDENGLYNSYRWLLFEDYDHNIINRDIRILSNCRELTKHKFIDEVFTSGEEGNPYSIIKQLELEQQYSDAYDKKNKKGGIKNKSKKSKNNKYKKNKSKNSKKNKSNKSNKSKKRK